jgi:hypothetical protein
VTVLLVGITLLVLLRSDRHRRSSQVRGKNGAKGAGPHAGDARGGR